MYIPPEWFHHVEALEAIRVRARVGIRFQVRVEVKFKVIVRSGYTK